jgi:hypothetical protein
VRRCLRGRSGGGRKALDTGLAAAEQMESVRRRGAGASGGAAVTDSGQGGGGAGAASGGRGERGGGTRGNQSMSAMCETLGRASGMQPRDVSSENGRRTIGMRTPMVLGMSMRFQSCASGGEYGSQERLPIPL